jgi:glycosyltransferase involved in cell wall biosynthesis
MSALDLVIVSTFPPDRGNLAEYGLHMSRALADAEGVGSVTVLANEVASAPSVERIGKVLVHRVWKLNQPLSFARIILEARRKRPHVVFVNAGIRTWGKSRRASVFGAALGGQLRLAGLKVVTMLHTIGDTVRLDQMGVGPFTQAGMKLASHAYLRANIVTVTMPSMQAALIRMGADNVAHIAHGTWGARVNEPPNPKALRILSFGFWGAFKDADLLVDATAQLREQGVNVELVLGGGPHPYFPEIYQNLVERFGKHSWVRFTGYVPEAELGALFGSVSLVVLPYRTNAGASGVLNLCRSYGLPTVISNEEALLEQLRFEGGSAMVFDEQVGLVDGLKRLLTDPALRRRMGEENLAVARKLTIDTQAAKLRALFADLAEDKSMETWCAPHRSSPSDGRAPRQSALVHWPPSA